MFGNILHDIALGIVFGCAWKCNYAGISCMRAFVSDDKRNTVGGILLGGVSLADDYPSIWNSTFSGSVLISGSSAKLEGSIVVLAINLILIIILAVLIAKQYRMNALEEL